MGNQGGFAFYAVDAINHIIKTGMNQLLLIFLGDKFHHRLHPAFRINPADTFRHHIHFQLTNITIQGMNLAVGIGNADIVHINQGNRADAGTRQRFGGPGTHPADTHHAHLRIVQTLQTGHAV